VNQHLHPDILLRIENAKKQGGVRLDELAVGTKLEVQTRNTLYRISVLGNSKYLVEGGRKFPHPTETYLGGSTWGGSMIKVGWLGIGMHMEFTECVTTAVETIRIVAPNDKWEYTLDASLV
jgi:hypothetical protein